MPLLCKLSTENHWCCIISVHDGVCSVSHPVWGGGCLCTPLLLSHCIRSRESTPKAWKRHTPLSLLQDPDTAQIHDEGKKKKKIELTQVSRNGMYCLWCANSIVQHAQWSLRLKIRLHWVYAVSEFTVECWQMEKECLCVLALKGSAVTHMQREKEIM